MNFKENPFFILNVNLFDNKEKILQKSEDAVFEIEDDLIQSAVKDLTNPKRRLYWELRWLLCIASDDMTEILTYIKTNQTILIHPDNKGNILCYVKGKEKKYLKPNEKVQNTVACALTLVNTYSNFIQNSKNTTSQAKAVHGIAVALEKITSENVNEFINRCREISELPKSSAEDIVEALNEYIAEIKETLRNALAEHKTNTTFLKNILLRKHDYMKYGDLADLFIEFQNEANALMMPPFEKMTVALANASQKNNFDSESYLTIIAEFRKFVDLAIWITRNNPEEFALLESIILTMRGYAIKQANEYKRYNESQSFIHMLKDKCPNDFSETKNKLYSDCNDIDKLINDIKTLSSRSLSPFLAMKETNSSRDDLDSCSDTNYSSDDSGNHEESYSEDDKPSDDTSKYIGILLVFVFFIMAIFISL